MVYTCCHESRTSSTALLKAMQENWAAIFVISDCHSLIQKINSDCDELSELGLIVNDISLKGFFLALLFLLLKMREQPL